MVVIPNHNISKRRALKRKTYGTSDTDFKVESASEAMFKLT